MTTTNPAIIAVSQRATIRTAGSLRSCPLLMPRPRFPGQRLPASYANFYIANGLVIVPQFDDPADSHARHARPVVSTAVSADNERSRLAWGWASDRITTRTGQL